MSAARKSGTRRTALRASASAPPSSRSTTQMAVRHSSPASRSASTRLPRRPPLVTTSSTRQTSSPGLELALEPVLGAVALRLLADDEEREAPTRARPTPRARPRRAPGPASRVARRARTRAHRAAIRSPSSAQEVGPRLEAVLVQVVARAPPRAQHEVALEERVLAEQALASSASVIPAPTARTRRASGKKPCPRRRSRPRARPSSRRRSRRRRARASTCDLRRARRRSPPASARAGCEERRRRYELHSPASSVFFFCRAAARGGLGRLGGLPPPRARDRRHVFRS